MEWHVHDARTVYESDVIRLELADVRLADGSRIEHHVLRSPFALAAVVVRDARGVLLLRRHRFILDRWLWDVPAGKVADGETLEDAAVRAPVDETGRRPDGVRLLGAYHPLPGISDQRVTICTADGAERVGDPDPNECERVEWVDPARARELELGGISLTAVLWAT